MGTRTESSDEAIGILEGIRDTYEEIVLDVTKLRMLGNLLEVADYEKIGGLTDKEFGAALNGLIEGILERQEGKLKNIYDGSRRVQEIIERAKRAKE